jgi:hypothetical protein
MTGTFVISTLIRAVRRGRHLKFRHAVLILLVFSIVVPFASIAYGQSRSEKIFDVVLVEWRPRLLERLKEYVGYESTRQYEKLYELLYERADKNASKEAYSTSRSRAEGRNGVIQEFEPTFITNITLNDGDSPTLSLIGRAKVLRRGRILQKEMTMNARLQDGEWYFSELSKGYLHTR